MIAGGKQRKVKLKQEIVKLKAILAHVTTQSYRNQYQWEQWFAWIRFALTRKLPKNKEWMFTTAFVNIPLITFQRKGWKTKLIELLLQKIQLKLCHWWSKPLAHQTTLRQSVLTVPVPHLVREDTAEHIEMLDLFLYEKVKEHGKLLHKSATKQKK
jgi:hypothetical protein